jgi:hypothetical protein
MAEAQEAAHTNDGTAQHKQNQAKRLFARLRIQTTSTLTAVCGGDGTTYTDTHGMATALAAHWRQVFTRQTPDPLELDRWLAEAERTRPPHPEDWADPRHWNLRRSDIAQALKQAGDSAAGPDGIPYSALRRSGPLLLETLFTAAQHLEEHGPEGIPEYAASFNHGLLCCLPKSASQVQPDGGPL